MSKEYTEIPIFDDGCGYYNPERKEGGYYTADKKPRLEIFKIMSNGGWRFLCSTPADRSAAMCEHWRPEILTFERETP